MSRRVFIGQEVLFLDDLGFEHRGTVEEVHDNQSPALVTVRTKSGAARMLRMVRPESEMAPIAGPRPWADRFRFAS